MIESEITETSVQKPFPKLVSSTNGLVLLVTKEKGGLLEGVVLCRGRRGRHDISECRTDWIALHFQDFTGEITLSNS